MLVAGQDALDQFFMREPERLLGRSVEEAIIDLANPHILDAHLQAAAYEAPLTADDEQYFGEAGMLRAEAWLPAGRLRRRAGGLVWTRPHSPAAETSLRSASASSYVIVETRAGTVLGTVEHERVFRFAHPGAVYLHLGQSFLVERLDLEGRTVLVKEFDGDYYTQAKTDKNVLIAGQGPHRGCWRAGASLFFGQIEVTEQVIAYQKRSLTDNRSLDTISLDLPEQVFTTEALWLTLTAATPRRSARRGRGTGRSARRRARQYRRAAPVRHVRPLGHRRLEHARGTGRPISATIFIYDGYPGGIGLVKARLRRLRGARRRRPPAHRRVPVRERLPVVRAEPQVRQPQRAAQ